MIRMDRVWSIKLENDAALSDILRYCNKPSQLHSTNGRSSEGTLAFGGDSLYKLMQVYVLTRHGDRMPTYTFPELFPYLHLNCTSKDASMFSWDQMNDFQRDSLTGSQHVDQLSDPERDSKCDAGMLTVEGHRQLYILGSHFKDTYSRWFEQPAQPTDWKSHLFVHSTDYQRTQHSAASFLLGFLPDNVEIRKAVTIYTSKGVTLYGVPDGSKIVYYWCKKLTSIISQGHKSDEYRAGNVFYQDVLKDVANVFDTPLWKLPPQVTQLQDQVLSHLCHNVQLPCGPEKCFNTKILQQLSAYATWSHSNQCSIGTSILMMQPFIYNTLFQQMNMAITKDKNEENDYRKFYFHFCHDSTLTAFLKSFSLPTEEWPPYASRITLELWKRVKLEGQAREEDSWYYSPYYIRILLNGESITAQMQLHVGDFEHARELLKFRAWKKYIESGNFRSQESYTQSCQGA